MRVLPQPGYQANAVDSMMFYFSVFANYLCVILFKLGICLLPRTICPMKLYFFPLMDTAKVQGVFVSRCSSM